MAAIIISTLNEALRKKTFIVMGVVTFLYLVFWCVLVYYYQKSINADQMQPGIEMMASRMITQMGLQFSSTLMALLTVMLGSGAIASELETGLIHGIISRPLHRYEYVLGKLVGLIILVSVYASILFSLLLCIGAFFGLSTIGMMSVGQILSGWALYLSVPIAVLCITLFGSCTFKTVPNGLLMIFIYILGNVGGMVEMVGKYINSASVSAAGIFLSIISPFHTLFTTMERAMLPNAGIVGDMMSGAGGMSGSGSPPSNWMYLYIGIYMIGFVALTVRKFSRRDIV